MNKPSAFLFTAALALSPLSMMPLPVKAAGTAYELEAGRITDTGDNVTTVVPLSRASGGKVVDLKDQGDAVSVEISVPSAGTYSLTLRYCQPYDENGKYQNVLVNGSKIGQILCAYTGEGTFRTVSISTTLEAGKNTVTIEGDWGWTYLDSLTLERGASAKSALNANFLISRDVPAYSSGGNASAGNDGAYYTA